MHVLRMRARFGEITYQASYIWLGLTVLLLSKDYQVVFQTNSCLIVYFYGLSPVYGLFKA